MEGASQSSQARRLTANPPLQNPRKIDVPAAGNALALLASTVDVARFSAACIDIPTSIRATSTTRRTLRRKSEKKTLSLSAKRSTKSKEKNNFIHATRARSFPLLCRNFFVFVILLYTRPSNKHMYIIKQDFPFTNTSNSLVIYLFSKISPRTFVLMGLLAGHVFLEIPYNTISCVLTIITSLV
uniref:Uncharacterized protein n=1 Tax=Ciona savignyi TaxID=51511 RepID=H2ZR84_CIOSA